MLPHLVRLLFFFVRDLLDELFIFIMIYYLYILIFKNVIVKCLNVLTDDH